jgi:membrane protein implicated in regulation of membrane protease activity
MQCIGRSEQLGRATLLLVFFLIAIALLLVLPSPWNVVGFGVCFVLFVGEILFWNGRVRGRRAQVGAQTLIGQRATVVSACRPDGQVRVAGEIWHARCADGADPDDTVVVTARDRLTLVVEREA